MDDAAGLRPTPDRVRETLFNWLAPTLAGARCLDLFAGSGLLGLEALSRGAGEVVFVDIDGKRLEQIAGHLARLGGLTRAQCVTAPADTFLARPPEPFDLVFLDPPFDRGELDRAVGALGGGWLRRDARVYLEAAVPLEPSFAERPTWRLLRSGRAGRVHYALATPISPGEAVAS